MGLYSARGDKTHTLYPLLCKKRKDESTFATGGLIRSRQIALIANNLKSEHMLVYWLSANMPVNMKSGI